MVPKLSMKVTLSQYPEYYRFNVEILAGWMWDMNIHGALQPFLLLLEDTDGDSILFHDVLLTLQK